MIKNLYTKIKNKVSPWFKNSLTIFLATVGTVTSGAMVAFDQLLNVFPVFFSGDLITQLKAYVPAAQQAGVALVMSIMFGLARIRSLVK